jgi:hypothetical protein
MQVFDNIFTSVLSFMLTRTFPIITVLFKKHDVSEANCFSYYSVEEGSSQLPKRNY